MPVYRCCWCGSQEVAITYLDAVSGGYGTEEPEGECTERIACRNGYCGRVFHRKGQGAARAGRVEATNGPPSPRAPQVRAPSRTVAPARTREPRREPAAGVRILGGRAG